jgi:hypothetical protein
VEIRLSEGLEGAEGKPAPGDAALDRFAAAFLRLAEQHWVQQEQLMNLISVLESKGLVSAAELGEAARNHEASLEREQALRDFIARTMGPLRERV